MPSSEPGVSTPGPWWVKPDPPGGFYVMKTAPTGHDYSIARVYAGPLLVSDREANANLIARSPEQQAQIARLRAENAALQAEQKQREQEVAESLALAGRAVEQLQAQLTAQAAVIEAARKLVGVIAGPDVEQVHLAMRAMIAALARLDTTAKNP